MNSSPSYQLSILVHPDPNRLADEAEHLRLLGIHAINVGATLSLPLCTLQPDERSISVEPLLRDALRPPRSLLHNIDLLFEPSLQLAPLHLLQSLSHYCSIVVLWPGSWDGTTLIYSQPLHTHYEIWKQPDAHITSLDA